MHSCSTCPRCEPVWSYFFCVGHNLWPTSTTHRALGTSNRPCISHSAGCAPSNPAPHPRERGQHRPHKPRSPSPPPTPPPPPRPPQPRDPLLAKRGGNAPQRSPHPQPSGNPNPTPNHSSKPSRLPSPPPSSNPNPPPHHSPNPPPNPSPSPSPAPSWQPRPSPHGRPLRPPAPATKGPGAAAPGTTPPRHHRRRRHHLHGGGNCGRGPARSPPSGAWSAGPAGSRRRIVGSGHRGDGCRRTHGKP